MVIVSLLIALAIPAAGSLGRAQKLSTATQVFIGDLDYARQIATARSRTVEFRFYKLPRSHSSSAVPEVFRAYQIFVLEKGTKKALTEIRYLPPPVVAFLRPTVSSILDPDLRPFKRGDELGTPLPGPAFNYEAAIFKFTPDGSTDLAQDRQWFVSLVLETDPIVAKNLPANYSTIQIDPFNGRPLLYRPD